MSSLNILISGSGIAGSVFATWLLRAFNNATITIVERAPALRLTGASVDIRSSAVDIIKWMGVEQQIRDHSTQEQGIQFVEEDGKPYATFGATGRSDIQSITSEYEIFRGALAKIFVDPIQDRVKFIFDEFVERYEECGDGVMVTFAKSKQVKKYDLLVAADGFGSRIRGQMMNTNPREQIWDEGVHVCYFTVNRDMLQGSRFAKWYGTTGGRLVLLRPDPAGRTRAHLMNITTNKDVDVKKKLNQALAGGNENYMQLMEEMFKDVGFLVPEVLESMRESDDFYCSLFAQVRSPKLQSGRVVLLGDAGYATPGFGTSLAIMGGYLLAGELLNHDGSVTAALQRYEEIMIPFAKIQQGDDQMMQWLNPQTHWGIRVRNFILSFITGLRLDKLAMNAASWLGFTEKKLEMPSYEWPTQ